MEMSPYPEASLPAADRLHLLARDASHLQHMPTHIVVVIIAGQLTQTIGLCLLMMSTFLV